MHLSMLMMLLAPLCTYGSADDGHQYKQGQDAHPHESGSTGVVDSTRHDSFTSQVYLPLPTPVLFALL